MEIVFKFLESERELRLILVFLRIWNFGNDQ